MVRMDIDEALAAELRAEKSRHRLTMKQIAEATGISADTAKRYFWGKRPVPIGKLDALCKVFGVPASELVARAEAAMLAAPTAPTVSDEVLERVAEDARATRLPKGRTAK